jgi:hexokinase
LLVLAAQFLTPRLPHEILKLFKTTQHWGVTSPDITPRGSVLFKTPPTCPKPEQQVEFKGTFYKEHDRSMALVEQARRVSAEFDFDADHVRKAVKEFIREMGTSGELCHAIDLLTGCR